MSFKTVWDFDSFIYEKTLLSTVKLETYLKFCSYMLNVEF